MMAVIAQYDPKQEKLDNTIKLVDTGYYEADNGRVKSEFYEAGNEVVFINKGRRISWKPENMKYLDEFGNEDIIYSVQDVPLEVKANYARFNRSMPDVDDWFIQENDRLKHQIIIQGFQRDPMPFLTGKIDFVIGGKLTFDSDLKVVANGIEQTGDFETDGAIHLYDGDTLVFTLPEVVAFDSAYDRGMVFGKYRVTQDTAGEFSFDIVLPNEWVSSLDRVYPIVIDPTVIVSSGYSTAGNGGRKLVELSNGWLVTAVYDSANTQIRFFKSSDNGQTWNQLCYKLKNTTSFAIESYENYVYCHASYSSDSQSHFMFFDATTVTNTNIPSSYLVTGQSVFGSGISLAINSAGPEIHTALTSRDSSLNSHNVRYCKGTINGDGSVTWGSVERVTNMNSSYIGASELSIIICNNNPYIILRYSKTNSPLAYEIAIVTTSFTTKNWGSAFMSSSWGSNLVYSSSYTQSSPSAIFVPQSVNGLPNGLIGVAWHGCDATHPTTDYIRFSKSTDLGANWSAMQKLVPGKNASLTADKNGKLYITYEDPADGQIKRIESTDNGDSWSSPYTVDTGTNPSMMFDYTFTNPFVAWVYMSGSSVKFEKLVLNQPPNAPILDTKSNFDATDNAVFSWTYSDPDPSDSQSAYQLEIIDVATGTTVYDTGKVASTTSSHTLPAETLTNNKQYQWRVKTWDNIDTEGAWSDYATFYTSAKPSVTITNLTEGQTIITSSLTVQWSMSDPESEGQSAYQIKLTDMSDTVLYDTGKVIDSVSRSRTLGYELENHTDYKVKISVWDGRDVKSEEQVISIHVSFTPPAEPNVTTTSNSQNASITINIEHPTPVDPQPTVIYSDVFRRKQGESNWMRIATGVQNSFTDYTPASGIVYEYKVRAWGDNETYTDSVVVSESVEFTGVWLHDTTDPSTLHQFKYDGDGRSENWQPTAAMMQFAGRKLPIAEYDDSETRSITVNLKMRKYDTDKEMLEKLIRSKNTLCYRDGRGRKMFCHALQLPISDEVYGNTVSITFEEVSYTEEV
jgi:hypothetical protein